MTVPPRRETRHLVDVGTGRPGAPLGSIDWALKLRLNLTMSVCEIETKPREIGELFALFCQHRVWTMVHDKYGDPFKTFDAFCEHDPPWGCGRPRREIESALVAVLGDRGTQLATVPPAETKQLLSGKPGPGRGKKNDAIPGIASFNDRSLGNFDARIRSISLHAPESARQLYREGLLGQKDAAKLAVRHKNPNSAGEAARIAIELAEEAKKLDTSTEALKRQAQRALNAKARELLGVRVDKVAAALRAFEALGADERERFLETGRTRGWWQ